MSSRGGVGGQNWVKFGPHSWGRTPKVQVEHKFIHQYTLHVRKQLY